MPIRKNILPKKISEALVTLFVLIIVPIIYYFELFVVFPKYYELWSGWYMFHFSLGTFILWNIISNFVSLILCDTSISGRLLPSNMAKNWKFCSVCESVAPPRSRHCETCNVCILKRDHHCIFVSCCVGHFNYRFFLMFVLYMFLATIYASYFNVMFIWNFVTFDSWLTVFKIVFPLAALFMKFTQTQLYVTLVLIVVIGASFTGVLLVYHANLVIKGCVTYEYNKNIKDYDLGVIENIKDSLGEKWYLVWASPLIESKLPTDGVNWDKRHSSKVK